MDTGTMVTVPVRNRIATREPNFRICRAILTRNRGAWCLDRRTRGMYTYKYHNKSTMIMDIVIQKKNKYIYIYV